MKRGLLALAAVVLVAGVHVPVSLAQSSKYPLGVFIAPRDGAPTELVAYADTSVVGEYRMAHGSLEDAPVVHEAAGALVSIPSFHPRFVFVTTAEIFRDHRAERRQLPVKPEKLSVFAVHLRIADLEDRARIESLLQAVGASADNPGYAFFAVESYGYVRYYPVRLTPLEQ